MKFLALIAAATAASAAAVAPQLSARQEGLLYPLRTYRRWIQTGQMVEDPQDQPLVVKNGNQADETSTVVSFEFDQSTEGKKCQLLFELWGDRDISEGSGQDGLAELDVFTYKNLPPTISAKSIEIKERDDHAGRILAAFDEEATWVQSYKGWPVIDCPAGEIIGIEYVGVGDNVKVQWDIGVTGPRFQVLE